MRVELFKQSAAEHMCKAAAIISTDKKEICANCWLFKPFSSLPLLAFLWLATD